jgi:hypothetical protein
MISTTVILSKLLFFDKNEFCKKKYYKTYFETKAEHENLIVKPIEIDSS